jgi:hypothetical protein
MPADERTDHWLRKNPLRQTLCRISNRGVTRMEITFHFGAAGHPVSWILHAAYGSHYGVALAAAHTWHERMIASARNGTPPGGQFVIEVKNDAVARTDLIFDADYFRQHQEPEDCIWLCQFQSYPLAIPEIVKRTVTEALRRELVDVGFLIPRAEWEERYPEQAEMLRQFREAMQNRFGPPHDNGKDAL